MRSLLKLDAKLPGTIHYSVPIRKGPFLELLDHAAVPPNFLDALVNNNGVYASYNAFTPAAMDDCLEARRILIKLPNTAPIWSAIHYQYDERSMTTTTLIIGSHLDWIENALLNAFLGSAISTQHDDPFDVLATIFAEFSEIIELKRLAVDHQVLEAEDITGLSPLRRRKTRQPGNLAIQSTLYLHRVSGHMHFVERASSFQNECLGFLLQQHELLTRRRLRRDLGSDHHHKINVAAEKARYSMELSASYARTRSRQLLELIYRIEMQVKTVDNLIAQGDARANLAIAQQSRLIAIDTKRDSIAMKTIAGLTMVFLPGTFVATIFSMVFFQVEQDNKHALKVSPNWWLYVVVTIPLTAAVLMVWIIWLRWKVRSKVEPLITTDSENQTSK